MRVEHVPSGWTLASLIVMTSMVSVGLTRSSSAELVICEKSGSLATLDGRYVVQNNVWGADTAQCVEVSRRGFTVTRAEHNNPTHGAPAAFPSIYAGCHHANCSAGSMPIRVSEITSADSGVDFAYPDGGTGAYNATYDIWLDPTPRTDGQNGAEVMIWLNRQGPVQPIGERIGEATIEGRDWEVWYGNQGWHVVSFVSPEPVASYHFSPLAFIDDLVSRGYIDESWYLTSLQAGFELWTGGTGLAVTSFSANVNGG